MRTKLWLALVLCLPLGCAAGGGDHHAAGTDHDPHNSDDAHAAHWGYGEGDGPDRWSSLKGDWALCASGTAQSPIDLHGTEDASDVDRLALDLPEASLRVIRQEHVLHPLNNGHTIQVNVDAGDTLTIGDQSFVLQQYHFHSPSEHTVNGTHYPMEMHLVHKSGAGELAVIGVFIDEGEHNAAFDTVWSNMPTEPGTGTHIEHVRVNIDEMLPSNTMSWRYHGSLTTPPCTEGVRWIVLKTPIQLDAAQVKQFKNVFTGNNRPTQPLNGRSIVTDSPVVR